MTAAAVGVLAAGALLVVPALSARAASLNITDQASCLAVDGGDGGMVWDGAGCRFYISFTVAANETFTSSVRISNARTMTNNGTMTVAGLSNASSFVNNGTLTITSGSLASVQGSFVNNGTIHVGCGVTVDTTVPITGNKPVIDSCPPPVITVANVTAEATSAAGAVVSYTATANDQVDGVITPTCTPASGTTFALGSTTVACTATDKAGHTASKSFTVKVVDTTKPVLAAPADVTAGATSAAGAPVTYTAPTATDLVDGSIPSTCTPASGSTFALGSTTVTCTATDKAGNAASTSFSVKVTQATATISFTAPSSPALVKGSATLAATATSGLPVVFSVDASSTTGACRISDGTVWYARVGTCVIDADQAGDATHPAALRVQRSVKVVYGIDSFHASLSKGKYDKDQPTIVAKFRLVDAHGRTIRSSTASALAAAKAITVTLAGPGITAVTSTCSVEDGVFVCRVKVPSHAQPGRAKAYTLTANEDVDGTGALAIPGTGNPVTLTSLRAARH